MTILDHALAWHLRGYAPLPLRTDGTKAPAVKEWTSYRDNGLDIKTMLELFKIDTDGIGLLTGSASKGLELFELEGRTIAEGYLPKLIAAFDAAGQRALWERVAGGYVDRTPSGGVHYYYRVGGPRMGSRKLARRPSTADELAGHQAQQRALLPDIADPALRAQRAERIEQLRPEDVPQVLIETRGQGGFAVIAPSGGRSHKTGQAWTVLAGSMDTIPTLTAEERDTIHAIARTLDEMPVKEQPAPRPTPVSGTEPAGGRPGDDYNARGNWDVLVRHGWRVCRVAGGTTYWTRPGKEVSDGVSATTGHSDDGVDRLWVFSSSTEFEPDTPYSRLAVLAELEHGGDFAAAAKALAKQGYGSSSEQIVIPIDRGPTAPAPSNVVPIRPEPPASTPAPTDGSAAIAAEIAESREPIAIELARYGPTEDGLARALVDQHGHELRYCPQRSSWLTWDGTRWRWDEAGRHREHLKRLARQLPDNETWKVHRKRMLTARGVDGASKMALSDARVVVDAAALDANPLILNTPSGVVDLRTGELRPADPGDLCTRITATPYDPDATAPRWSAFLNETFDGDEELITYLQHLAGYSACGVVTHHVLPFAYGPGGAGKTVFLETIPGVLGEYASNAPAGFLMAGRHDESAIASLHGARLVVCSEVNERDRFDEAKVKLLTGGDKLRSRFLYGNYFSFTPTHHLWLMGNHQPRVEAGGNSFWRRLRVLPFAHTVPPERRIEGFADLLRTEEGPGILSWIVRGAIHVLNNKLHEPERVRAATETYAAEEDHLSRFIEECVMLTASGREKASDVRSAYTSWCSSEGITASSNQVLVRELRTRWGIEAVRSHGTRYYGGLTLLSSADEPEDDDPRATHWSDR